MDFEFEQKKLSLSDDNKIEQQSNSQKNGQQNWGAEQKIWVRRMGNRIEQQSCRLKSEECQQNRTIELKSGINIECGNWEIESKSELEVLFVETYMVEDTPLNKYKDWWQNFVTFKYVWIFDYSIQKVCWITWT